MKYEKNDLIYVRVVNSILSRQEIVKNAVAL
jgi:hypothetical protein